MYYNIFEIDVREINKAIKSKNYTATGLLFSNKDKDFMEIAKVKANIGKTGNRLVYGLTSVDNRWIRIVGINLLKR